MIDAVIISLFVVWSIYGYGVFAESVACGEANNNKLPLIFLGGPLVWQVLLASAIFMLLHGRRT